MALIVTPCFCFTPTSRSRSANSLWWKFDSANQRSTRAGTLRPCFGCFVGRLE